MSTGKPVIVDELIALKDYITRKCVVNCGIGDRDRKADELPIVEVVPTGDIDIFLNPNKTMTKTDMKVILRVKAERDKELDALSVFEKLCLFLGQFNDEKGHIMEGPFTGEYSESQYTLSGAFTIKLIIHDT